MPFWWFVLVRLLAEQVFGTSDPLRPLAGAHSKALPAQRWGREARALIPSGDLAEKGQTFVQLRNELARTELLNWWFMPISTHELHLYIWLFRHRAFGDLREHIVITENTSLRMHLADGYNIILFMPGQWNLVMNSLERVKSPRILVQTLKQLSSMQEIVWEWNLAFHTKTQGGLAGPKNTGVAIVNY